MTKAPQLYIAMELCSQQNFRDRMKKNVRFNFDETLSFTRQLLSGMQHIHDNGVIHRDVKAEYLLLSEDETLLKVADFGLSKELEPNQSVTNISTLGQGTNAYRAPETHNSNKITKSADIFCLGITMFEFFSNGKHPFGDDTTLRDHNIKNNKGHDYSGLLIIGTKRKEFLDLIKWMLNKDPKKRPTIIEVVQHQFFSTLSALKRTDYHRSKSSESCIPRPEDKQVQRLKAIEAVKCTKSPQAHHRRNEVLKATNSQWLQKSFLQQPETTPSWGLPKLLKNVLQTCKGPITLAANVDGHLTVNVKALERFLKQDELKGRPLAIISIAGEIRSGKSFIMNFFIRYLRKKGWENPNWFGDTDHEMMDGFVWSKGMSGTEGINIWSEIFDVPLPDGRKAAVLLVDTQGFFYELGESEDTSARIMLTSILFSSHQILNLMHRIQERHLTHLELCASISKLAMSTGEGGRTKLLQLCASILKLAMSTGEGGRTKPFQTLTLLVRDWKRDFEFEFGDSTHGYLQGLFGKHSVSENIRKLTDSISTAFSDMRCFLLPDPGRQVLRYNVKNLLNKDLHKDFQEFSKKFVEGVLHPQNIVVKRNREGDEATVDDLLRMIRPINDQCKEMPIAEMLLQSVVNANNARALVEAIAVYKEKFGELCRGHSPGTALKESHEEALKFAVCRFHSIATIGDDMSKAESWTNSKDM